MPDYYLLKMTDGFGFCFCNSSATVQIYDSTLIGLSELCKLEGLEGNLHKNNFGTTDSKMVHDATVPVSQKKLEKFFHLCKKLR